MAGWLSERVMKGGQSMQRSEILDTAKGYVTKDRQADHGAPEDTFGAIAELWTSYVRRRYPDGLVRGKHWIDAADVAAMMALMKVARITQNPAHPDNWVDLAGYAACGGELATYLPTVTGGPVKDAA